MIPLTPKLAAAALYAKLSGELHTVTPTTVLEYMQAVQEGCATIADLVASDAQTRLATITPDADDADDDADGYAQVAITATTIANRIRAQS